MAERPPCNTVWGAGRGVGRAVWGFAERLESHREEKGPHEAAETPQDAMSAPVWVLAVLPHCTALTAMPAVFTAEDLHFSLCLLAMWLWIMSHTL